MSLVKYPECGREISSFAKACPNCGENKICDKVVYVNGTQSDFKRVKVAGSSYADLSVVGESRVSFELLFRQ